jgi:hypothetical protein
MLKRSHAAREKIQETQRSILENFAQTSDTANPYAQNTRALNTFPEWTLGDSITKITPQGAYPSWETIRSRYWKNRIQSDPTGFGKANSAIMQEGFAPKARVTVRDRATGQVYEKLVSKELHHARGNRGVPTFDEPIEIREVWPWEHEKLLPGGRHLNYDFLGFKD